MSLARRLARRDTTPEPEPKVREAYVEKAVIRRAKRNGWTVRKMQWIGTVGAPDRFFAKWGVVILCEFKAPGKKPRKEQREEHALLRAAGVIVIVIDNVEDGYAVFQ